MPPSAGKSDCRLRAAPVCRGQRDADCGARDEHASDGTRVKFRTINEIDGTFSAAVTGRATGTHVVTDPGHGIGRLTYLVISR